MKKKLLSTIIAASMVVSIFSVASVSVSAATVQIGHASISENNTANGKVGDQTGKEVCTRAWYNKNWTAVIRAKDSKVANKIAKAMEQACANNNIGYGQSNRTTLYKEAKAKKWNLSAIKTKCNTDCSALVSVCVNAAGISVSKDMTTANEKSILSGTGKFKVYTSSDYTAKTNKLKRGDILLYRGSKSGHTAVVLSDGSQANNPKPEKPKNDNSEYYKACDSKYTSIVDALNSIGVDSSKANRKKIASSNGIKNYTGTVSQNTTMLKKLKAGTLKKPTSKNSKPKKTVSYFPKCSSNYSSIIDALKSVGANSSYDYRKKIASANGIKNYTGTTSQNTTMLKKLKAGTLKKP